jgi:SagB-type dehydrogenase family enzyme
MNRFHSFDSANRPNPYKIYKDLPSVDLPIQKLEKDFSALKAISNNTQLKEGGQISDLNVIANILHLSAGITKTINFPGTGIIEFRAASCTGALYHIEIYVVCQDVPGLDAGVYHFDPKEMKLQQLRKGDYRRVLVGATGNDVNVEQAPMILIYTDIFTRNSVKYQTREYRHAFWDCGTIMANTLAISSAHDLATKVIVGFVDEQVNSLLDLNTEKEVSLALVPIGFTNNVSGDNVPKVEALHAKTEPLSNYEIDDLEIQAMHQDSSLNSAVEVKNWQDSTTENTMPVNPENTITLQPSLENTMPQDSIESVIMRRGSTRQFSLESISLQQFSTIIYYATRGIQTDFLKPYGNSLIDLYVIVNAVDNLESGSYFYNQETNVLELLKEGKFRHVAGNLGLDQDIPADGSVSVFLMCDLNKVLKQFGNRGYRTSQLEASITGGKLYLGSYAHGLGATGLTFYDDAVTDFFSPHAKGKSVMFMVVIGKKNK